MVGLPDVKCEKKFKDVFTRLNTQYTNVTDRRTAHDSKSHACKRRKNGDWLVADERLVYFLLWIVVERAVRMTLTDAADVAHWTALLLHPHRPAL